MPDTPTPPPTEDAVTEPVEDEDLRALRRRDGRFLIRLGLLLGIILMAGALGVLWLGDADVGGHVARGFRALTQ